MNTRWLYDQLPGTTCILMYPVIFKVTEQHLPPDDIYPLGGVLVVMIAPDAASLGEDFRDGINLPQKILDNSAGILESVSHCRSPPAGGG